MLNYTDVPKLTQHQIIIQTWDNVTKAKREEIEITKNINSISEEFITNKLTQGKYITWIHQVKARSHLLSNEHLFDVYCSKEEKILNLILKLENFSLQDIKVKITMIQKVPSTKDKRSAWYVLIQKGFTTEIQNYFIKKETTI